MENVPEKAVDMWINHPKLNPRHLIPALLRYNHSNRIDRVSEVGAQHFISVVIDTNFVLDN
jgi:hypothetical protein